MNHVFTIEQMRPIRDGMTISRDAGLGSENTITFFSLGKGTSISQERYDMTSVYIGAEGNADFVIGEEKNKLKLSSGDVIIVPGKTLCGVECDTGAVYTEIIIKKEIIMNNILKTGEVFKLKDLIQYEEGSISNLDIVRNDTMKFVLMAFALEGQAVINCEGKDYNISAGENFRFEKDGLHSVTANGKFKMALLLVIE